MENKDNLVLVEKYLVVVKRNLFLSGKDEIIDDLRDNILEQLDGDYSENNVKKVLEQLGNPALLAIKYSNSDNYLIGPRIYDLYLYIMKISLQVSTLVFVIFRIVIAIIDSMSSNINIVSFVLATVGTYIGTILNVFIWVTIVFVVLERVLKFEKVNETLMSVTKWDIEKLDVVQMDKGLKKSNIIATIIFTPIALFLVIAFSDFTIVINEESYFILNQSIINQTIVLFGISALLNICVQVMLLIKNRWTRSIIVFDLFSQLFGLYISYYLIVDKKLFNFLEFYAIFEFSEVIYSWIAIGVIVIAVITVLMSIYKFIKVNND